MTPIFTLSRRRALLSFSATTAAMAIPQFPATANIGDDGFTRRKISLSGRQRMLSQRMSRAIFFLGLEIGTGQHLKMLNQAHTSFDQALTGLRRGDDALELTEETATDVLGKIEAVAEVWSQFGGVIAQVIDRKTPTEADLEYVARVNLDLLSASNAVVKALVTTYGDKSMDMGLAIAIDVADRQRMLGQRMAKEAAMIAAGFEPGEMQMSLVKTVQLFDGSLTALMQGLPTITLPPPPDHIYAKLTEVQQLWSDYAKVIRFVADTGVASPFELEAIAVQADPLLATMSEAVTLYEES